MELRRNIAGIEALPVTLLLSVMIGACALGLGARCLTNLQGLTEKQRATGSFDAFVERAMAVSIGGVGGRQRVELDLPNSKIVCRGRLLQLVLDNEEQRSQIVSLPILVDGNDAWEIDTGYYEIELYRDTFGNCLLKLRRL